MENHYNIKKHSLLWTILIDDDIISGYPVINPISEAEYNWRGYNDTPHSITEWNVDYTSVEKASDILNQNIKYLQKHNYHLKKSNGVACNGEYFENTYYFTTTEDCITLALTPRKDKTRVRFYLVRGSE